MIINKYLAIVPAIVFLAGGVANAQTQVPNTFQAGTPARAADVNANFNAVEASVDDNAATIVDNQSAIQANTQSITDVVTITIPRVKANGQDIGAHMTGHAFSDAHGVISNTGYLFEVIAVDTTQCNPVDCVAGEIKRWILRYATANCTGQAFVHIPNVNHERAFGNGYVIASQNLNDQSIYYSPKGSTVLPGTVLLSRTHIAGAGCTTEPTPLTSDVMEVIPNDSEVTGVPLQFFTPPITLDVQTVLVHVPSP